MSKLYKIFSNAYRIILGLFIVIFTIKSLFFPENNQKVDYVGLWSLVFSIVALIAITIFHKLGNNNRLKIFMQFFVCVLLLISLAFLTSLFFSGEDGNLLIHSVFAITTFVNVGLLFYLAQDRKFNHNN